jgi:hypothetical protein
MHAVAVRVTIHDFEEGRKYLREELVPQSRGTGLRRRLLGPGCGEPRRIGGRLRVRGGCTGRGGTGRHATARGGHGRQC